MTPRSLVEYFPYLVLPKDHLGDSSYILPDVGPVLRKTHGKHVFLEWKIGELSPPSI